jgi:hypothetical protein
MKKGAPEVGNPLPLHLQFKKNVLQLQIINHNKSKYAEKE